jgi:hypothetical protein
MGVHLPLPAPRYFYPKALIIQEITATAINPRRAVSSGKKSDFSGTETGTKNILFIFNCLN